MPVYLNDDCWICIFTHLPLKYLFLRIKLVCHRWSALVSCVTKRKRALTIAQKLIYHDLLDGYLSCSNDRLDGYNTVQNKTLERLTNQFANITSLDFRQVNSKEIVKLYYLLEKWPNLVTIKVIVGGKENHAKATNQEWNSLLKKISTIRSLRHLTIYELNMTEPGIRLPSSLSKLSSFYLGLMFEDVAHSLEQIATHWSELNKFGLITQHEMMGRYGKGVTKSHYTGLFQTKLPSNITELRLNIEFDIHLIDSQISFHRNYQSVSHLYLRIYYPLHWMMLESGLHNMANLAYLNIQNEFHQYHRMFAHESDRPVWYKNPVSTPPLYLSLNTLHLAHVPHYPFDWAQNVLSNLEILKMDDSVFPSSRTKGEKVFTSLNVFPKLRQVFFVYDFYESEPKKFKIEYENLNYEFDKDSDDYSDTEW